MYEEASKAVASGKPFMFIYLQGADTLLATGMQPVAHEKRAVPSTATVIRRGEGSDGGGLSGKSGWDGHMGKLLSTPLLQSSSRSAVLRGGLWAVGERTSIGGLSRNE